MSAVPGQVVVRAEVGQSQRAGILEVVVTRLAAILESQRRAFDAQSALLSARLELFQNRVDLYLALGGDFDHPLFEK